MVGKPLKDLTLAEVFHAELKIKQWFTFLDNNKLYKSTELFKMPSTNSPTESKEF